MDRPHMLHTDGKKYRLLDHDLIVVHGGHGIPSNDLRQPIRAGSAQHGLQTHYPIFEGEDGAEYICKDGHNFIRLLDQKFDAHRRELRHNGGR